MAAIHSAGSRAETVVLEANENVGRKLLLTGGGRCNFTHIAIIDELVRTFRATAGFARTSGAKGSLSSVPTPPKRLRRPEALRMVEFLRHSFYQFPPVSVRQFFQKHGLISKVEDDGCVFPATNRAEDVRDVLLAEAKRLGVRFIFSRKVVSIEKWQGHFIIRTSREIIEAEKVIIATGGMSYPHTGSTGDGYKFAKHFGHTIIQPRASFVPLVTLESWPSNLAGTSVNNVKITASINKKKIVVAGALLFTHDGIGGPAVLELSRLVTDFLPSEKNPLKIFIDLVAVSSEEELEKMILRQISEHPHKTVANILAEIVPRRVSQILCEQFDFPAKLYANQLSKDTRRKLLHLLKALPLSIMRTRPIAEAMVTHGGVNLTEINPKTMESKICPGLFFAGEVIDVDGPCGGYNLQMCWSTGVLASSSAAQSKQTSQ